MNRFAQFVKSAGIYFAGNVLTKLIAFFLLPLYTAYIAPADMGYYNTSVSYLNIAIPVLCMEIWTAIMRFMFLKDEKQEKYHAVYQCLILFASSVLLYTLLFVGLAIWKPHIDCLFLIYLYGLFTMLQNVYSFTARGFGFDKLFALSGFCGSLLSSLANILMIVFLGMRLHSLYLAAILGLLLQIAMMEPKVGLLRHWHGIRPDPALIRQMLKFAAPLALNSACFWFLNGYNSVGITTELGTAANGLYAVAARFTTAVSLISTCFSLAWQELAYSASSREENKSDFYSTASDYYLRFLIAGLLLLVPFVSLIFPYMVKPTYADSYFLVPLYLFATIASVYSTFLGSIFSAENKTNIVFLSTLSAAIVNVSLFHTLIPRCGIQAANWALLIGFVVNILIRLLVLRHSVPVRIRPTLPLLLILGFTAEYVIYMRNHLSGNLLSFVLAILLTLVAFRPMLQQLLSILKRKRA